MWTTIIEVALKFIGMALDKSKADAQAKADFLVFVDSMAARGVISKLLNESDQRQVDELKKLRAHPPTTP